MYNYAGIEYRLWAECGSFFMLGIICSLWGKPWKNGLKKNYIGPLCILMSLLLFAEYAYVYCSKDVTSYTGEFVKSSRNSRVAPPLPFTDQYNFDDGLGWEEYYLDIFSKKEIWPEDFVPGEEYIVYYDKHTKVIVKIEKYGS